MKFKFGFLILSLVLTACSVSHPKNTVKITNLASNSGGSGTIVKSSEISSQILTNAHVCEVAKHGGLVHTLDGHTYFVTSYKESKLHDLCLITVAANLHARTDIASSAPDTYELALVSGHPRLMPNIVTTGHFAGKQIIQVLAGFKECTEDDMKNPDTAVFCVFFGKLPIVKSYEAIAVSATIQPGSSGSAVYTSSKDIGAVIFAGSGEIGYGYAVPYEYVRAFIEDESKSVPVQTPDFTLSLSQLTSKRDLVKKIEQFCEDYSLNEQVKKICTVLQTANKNNDLIEYN